MFTSGQYLTVTFKTAAARGTSINQSNPPTDAGTAMRVRPQYLFQQKHMIFKG